MCDDATLAVKVSTEVMRNPDASERVDESSLGRSSKTAGQGDHHYQHRHNVIVAIRVRLSLLPTFRIPEASLEC